MRLLATIALLVASAAAATLALTEAAARFAQGQVPDMAAPALQADRILVDKSDRLLVLFRNRQELARYSVSLGSGAEAGPKQVEGDGRTPEGIYRIDARNAKSRYHLSLRVSYPSGDDRARAAAMGKSAGGDIMIHGLPNGWGWAAALFQGRDWTKGCIAVTNTEMRRLRAQVPDGTLIEIFA
jgi:murein L,D-transpeptidase YafK